MRDRPFLTAGESPRPYSEVRAEQRGDDPARRLLEEIAELEAEAAAADVAADRKALQLEAEELRCALYHRPQTR